MGKAHHHSSQQHQSWEEWRRHVAVQAEKACCLPGNINGPDLDMGGYLHEHPPLSESEFA